MHTKEEQDPWWRVDLGKEYIITGKREGEFDFLTIGSFLNYTL